MHMNLRRCNEQKVRNENRNHGKSLLSLFVVLQPCTRPPFLLGLPLESVVQQEF